MWMKAVLLLSLMLCSASAFSAERVLLIDDFETGLRPAWKEKVFEGRTDYRVVPEGEGHVLRAESRGAASGLILEKEIDLKEFPVLSWRWKVESILEKGDARRKEGDDYAARIYVIFPHWFFPKTRSINYIWANKLPQGEIVPNPFTSNAVMVAVESGDEKVGEWVTETRNVRADYRAIFGEEPPRAGAIAIMTDTDNTGGSAVAWYDDIRLKGGGREGEDGGQRTEDRGQRTEDRGRRAEGGRIYNCMVSTRLRPDRLAL